MAPRLRKLIVTLSGLLLALAIGIAPASATVDCDQFDFHQTVNVGTHPTGLSPFDFDGDSTVDFVVANEGDGTVSIIKNVANVFSVHATLGVGSTPVGTAILDYNLDNRPDFAVANNGSNTMTLYRNLGGGSFVVVNNYLTGAAPYGPYAINVNNDSWVDLIVLNRGSGTMGVFLNSGSGFNTPMVSYPVGSGPIALAAADFNGNGFVDVAVANFDGNGIAILMNNSGTFGAPSSYGVFSNPQGICAAKFSADNFFDLAVASNGGPNVTILNGDGTGSFGFSQTLTGGLQMQTAVSGDFDRDGDLDLLVDDFGASTRLFTNQAGLLLDPPAICNYGDTPKHVTVDWDKNFALDLAAPLYNSNQCSFQTYVGPRVKRVPQDYASVASAVNAAVNGDSILVGPGTYAEDFSIGGKSLTLLSDSGETRTFLLVGTTIEVVGPSATIISGFTFTSGGYEFLRVRDGGSLRIESCVIHNTGYTSVTAQSAELVVIKRCLFTSSVAYNPITINNSKCEIINNTLIGDPGATGINIGSDSSGSIRNNIIFGFSSGVSVYGLATTRVALGFNDTWNCNSHYAGVPPGIGSMSVDPEFVSANTGYFELRESSACIDAGDPSPIYNDTDSSRNDVGAYAFNPDSIRPLVLGVDDIDPDQGGKVKLTWDKSKYDLASRGGIAKYSVWRATPQTAMNASTNSAYSKSSAQAHSAVRTLSTSLGTFQWEWIADLPSHYFEEYSFTAPTLFDSSGSSDGKHYFLVSAHSPDGVHVYDSEPDSGYSVDNLAPSAPVLLAVTPGPSGLNLLWSNVTAPDLHQYKVYRDTVPGVVPELADLSFEVEDTLTLDSDVEGGVTYFYRVAAVDFAGNVGEISNEVSGSTCSCPCAADPQCDGIRSDIVDVVRAIEIAFRSGSTTIDPLCTSTRSDVNCSGATDVIDIVRVINVAFRGANVTSEYCSPCQ